MQAQSPPAMEFFQSLLKSSGMSSSFANWMAPTLDPEELERKIVDLRVVLQWLEANVRLTQATIQGLEVQRMTLSTLKTMNVDFGDLASHLGSAMRAGAEAMGAATTQAAKPAEGPAAGKAAASQGQGDGERKGDGQSKGAEEAPQVGGIIDPMQWWSTLSDQFTKVATEALRDSAWPMPGAGAMPSGSAAGPAAGAAAASRSAAKAPAPGGEAAPARKRAGARAGVKPGSPSARSRKGP